MEMSVFLLEKYSFVFRGNSNAGMVFSTKRCRCLWKNACRILGP